MKTKKWWYLLHDDPDPSDDGTGPDHDDYGEESEP